MIRILQQWRRSTDTGKDPIVQMHQNDIGVIHGRIDIGRHFRLDLLKKGCHNTLYHFGMSICRGGGRWTTRQFLLGILGCVGRK